MASISGQSSQQQVDQQQQQQQQQQPQQQQQQQQQQTMNFGSKTFKLTPQTIEAIKNKIDSMGKPPFENQDQQRKYEHLSTILQRLLQLYRNGQHEVPVSMFQMTSNRSHQVVQQVAQVQPVQQQLPSLQPPQVASAAPIQPTPVVQHQSAPLQQPSAQQPVPPQSSHTVQPTTSQSTSAAQHQHPATAAAPGAAAAPPANTQTLEKKTLQELVKEVDPNEILEDEAEEILLQVADDFIENVINSSCQLAKHRKSSVLEAKDVQFHLERNFNIWIPGFTTDELKIHKKSLPAEAHKQRLQLIKKSAMKPNEPTTSGLSGNLASKDK